MKTLNLMVIVSTLALVASCIGSSQSPESNVDQNDYQEPDAGPYPDGQNIRNRTDSTTLEKPEQRPLTTHRLKPRLSIYQG